MNSSANENAEIRNKIQLENPEELYQIKDEYGNIIDYDQASGRQLFNHYRHGMTNYDEVLDDIREDQGHVKWSQQKAANTGAAEQVLELYRNEHVKVIQDSQQKGNFIKTLMVKFQVTTTTALVNTLDTLANNITELSNKISQNEDHIAFLNSSQGSYHHWNNTYRVQKFMVLETLRQDGIQKETIKKVEVIYKTKSVNKAIDLAYQLFDFEESEILKYFLKPAIREIRKFSPKN